ncbi:hypothetical protein ACQE3E_11210 [Methylomonas sp. MED-D]|uniref:hypothetical protein n=1 Tax=unclassified Methylomonas TaxID=2608980 RepID=UPI0028A4D73F|nr:hypothetical protein [Methylomonas sp. MV1]MDT4328446.1 hypothetical protein [Methylomonas sp. MV1]
MGISAGKLILVATWISIVFGYLYFLQKVYDNPQFKSFHLFVFLAIAGNLAYDGLKALLRYDPLHPSNTWKIVRFVAGFVASLAGSVASLLIGAELVVYGCLSNSAGQIVAGLGFLICIAFGMWLLAQAETYFKVSNRA